MDIKLEENGGGKILPTERLSLSCCSKMGCDNVFTRTKGQAAYEERTGIMNGIYFVKTAILQSIVMIQTKLILEQVISAFFIIIF